MTKRIIIGTRGSNLAMWQARAVAAAINSVRPDVETELRIIATTGDKTPDRPLESIGDMGLFTKELERALMAGEVDLCVHSMKDMPTALPAGLAILAMLPRADVRDALVCGPRIANAKSLDEVPEGSRLGTGSARRTAQLRALFPHVQPTPIRGNVETRLEKAAGADYEGAVLAAAGIVRLGASNRIAALIPIEIMVPAVGQGAIGVEARLDDGFAADICGAIDDPVTSACVTAERFVLAGLYGGCQAPIGVYARMIGNTMKIDAIACARDGSRVARVSSVESGPEDVIRRLVELGALDILAESKSRENGAAS